MTHLKLSSLSLPVVIGLAAFASVACSDGDDVDNILDCQSPALYTQANAMKSAVSSSENCIEKATALSQYISEHTDDITGAVTVWNGSEGNKNALCYLNDIPLYATGLLTLKSVYDSLIDCQQSNEGSSEISNAIENLTSLDGWSNILDAATKEAVKNTGE